MFIRAFLAFLAALLLTCAASAADLGSVVAAPKKPVPLFKTPDDDKPAAKADANDLPWPILEEKNDFYRVHVGGADYWVDSMLVRVSRGSSAKCGPVVKGAAKTPTGSTPGAGENMCN
jgi:hypothetical protein